MERYDPDYYDIDEGGNPEFHGHGPAKEEPDCYACCDRGTVTRRILWMRRSRPCPECRPTRLDCRRAALFSALYNSRFWPAYRRLRGHPEYTDESPF